MKTLAQALRSLTDHRTWRRHPAPFSKTPRGKARRQERHFMETVRTYAVEEGQDLYLVTIQYDRNTNLHLTTRKRIDPLPLTP